MVFPVEIVESFSSESAVLINGYLINFIFTIFVQKCVSLMQTVKTLIKCHILHHLTQSTLFAMIPITG